MKKYSCEDFEIAYETRGNADGPVVLWAHGWGQSHTAFLPLLQSFENTGSHTLIDFPGFGSSPLPGQVWGTAEYAHAVARFIREKIGAPVIWIGHSFGCRVGLQLAVHHPELVRGLFLISAAGLKPKRSLFRSVYLKIRIFLFKFLKKLIPLGLSEQKLYAFFGSADYKNAGGLRPVFVKVVNEDLSDTARAVKSNTALVYGALDAETPVEIGQRLHKLITASELHVLDELDHYSVLGNGRHRVAPLLKKFMERIAA